MSVEQYLDGIKPYLRDLINSHKNKEWKIQLNMYINFLSFKDTGETRFIYIWSDNEEIRWGNETDDVIDNLFESLLDNYQKEQQIMRGGSNFSFESVELLQYSLHKIKLKRGGSYMDPLEWIRNKLATINPKNYDDNNFFQYAITVALNHQNIENHPERISNIEPFINQYNWKDIDFPLHQKDWKRFEQNNKTIALNILFVPHNTKTIRVAYRSQYNNKRKKQVILLMITDGKKWHYLAVKSVPAWLRGIASNHNEDFYCLNSFHSYSTKNKLKQHESVSNDHDSCYVQMPNEGNKLLKYNQGEKSLKVPAIIYVDLECLLEKMHLCQNNPERT